MSSRLIPRAALESDNTAALIQFIRQGYETLTRDGARHAFNIIFASGKGDHKRTSVHPIWYESLWLVLYTGRQPHVIGEENPHNVGTLKLLFCTYCPGSWDTTSPQRVGDAVFKNLHDVLEPLRELTPGSGGYVNEVSLLNWLILYFQLLRGANFG